MHDGVDKGWVAGGVDERVGGRRSWCSSSERSFDSWRSSRWRRRGRCSRRRGQCLLRNAGDRHTLLVVERYRCTIDVHLTEIVNNCVREIRGWGRRRFVL
jgi:hypothetical protein